MSGASPGGTDGGRRGPHVPVMLEEVLAALAPKDGETFIDGTFGAGGYSSAILEAARTCVLAIERDPRARANGEALAARYGGRLQVLAGCFGDMDALAAGAGHERVDGVVLDIGVSSMQLDTPERGFSFMADGPLDMRMGEEGPSAATIVNEASESKIADILFHLGEERRARQIARAIGRARAMGPIETTRQLASLVKKTLGRARGDDKHPATRTFQALRMAVNDELGELSRGLVAAEHILKPGGRLVVVTFHSLEDRVVKRFLARRAGRTPGVSRHGPLPQERPGEPSFRIVNQRPLTPSQGEIGANPRARSAKLRAAERTGAPAMDPEPASELGMPPI